MPSDRKDQKAIKREERKQKKAMNSFVSAIQNSASKFVMEGPGIPPSPSTHKERRAAERKEMKAAKKASKKK